jgi:hypothetical protein
VPHPFAKGWAFQKVPSRFLTCSATLRRCLTSLEFRTRPPRKCRTCFVSALEKAKNRGCVIFWIAVSASTVKDSELSRLQAANDPEQPLDTLTEPEQNRVLVSIYNRMKEAVQ